MVNKWYTAYAQLGVCHQIASCQLNRISLSCFDDKRYLILGMELPVMRMGIKIYQNKNLYIVYSNVY